MNCLDGLDGRIILKWIFEKWSVVGHGLDWSASGYGQMAGSCDCGNETSVWRVS